MIRLIKCNKCGYIGDLSELPGDLDTSEMTVKDAELYLSENFQGVRDLFQLIGWTMPEPGYDLCPKCTAEAIK
jgi:hypothetical protein